MSSVNQWRDTNSVITWFESIKNKKTMHLYAI